MKETNRKLSAGWTFFVGAVFGAAAVFVPLNSHRVHASSAGTSMSQKASVSQSATSQERSDSGSDQTSNNVQCDQQLD